MRLDAAFRCRATVLSRAAAPFCYEALRWRHMSPSRCRGATLFCYTRVATRRLFCYMLLLPRFAAADTPHAPPPFVCASRRRHACRAVRFVYFDDALDKIKSIVAFHVAPRRSLDADDEICCAAAAARERASEMPLRGCVCRL